jgi:HAD superfamily hydrolase (TIGR01509 family)
MQREISTSKIKAIFFDNDGVLVNTERLYFLAAQKIFARLGANLTEKQYQDDILLRGLPTFDLLPPRVIISPETKKALYRERNRIYQELCANTDTSLPQVCSTIEKIRQTGDYILGVVTASSQENFLANHQQTGILPLMDFWVTRDDVSQSKPDPEPYNLALKKARVVPKQALVIEDSQRGLQAAVAAGIECWFCPHEMTKHQDFSAASRILKDFSQIPKYLYGSEI